MKAHWQYLKYVLRHKYYVYKAGRRLGLGRWQLLIHDASKFSRAEWGPYVRRFYGKSAYKPANGSTGYMHKQGDDPAFDAAWEHHWQNNAHHWQYYLHPMRDDTNLWVGDVVHGVPDVLPFQGVIVEWRIPSDTPPSSYKVQTNTDLFWALDVEIRKKVLPMPERYVREMVADWWAAGMAQGKPDIWAWYATNKEFQILHPHTRKRVEELLYEADFVKPYVEHYIDWNA